MKIGVLIDPNSWYWRDLQRAAALTDQLVPISFLELDGAVGMREEDRLSENEDWRSCDALLVRTMPPGSLEQVVLRMDLLGQWHEEGKLVLNPPRAMEIAVDKYLCSARLARAGLTIPATIACQTWQQAMQAYEELGGDLVVKPIFGGEGRGILRVEDAALAQRTFQTLQRLQAVMYLQPFIPHEGFDYRVFVLGEANYVIRRRHPTDWRTNLSRGATAEPVPECGPWVDLGRLAANAVGAPIAGVDILPGQDGQLYVLEVNAVPGWRGLQAVTGVDMAAEVLAYVRASAG